MKLKQWFITKIQNFQNAWLIEHREEYIRTVVPNNCFRCELLGLCRDEHNNWKCKHGCLVLNAERKKGEGR